MTDDAARIATAYFDAWNVNDLDTMQSLVGDDVTFAGPLGRVEGVEAYIRRPRTRSLDQGEVLRYRRPPDKPRSPGA
jgi:ketosteroid isomerase-like protein